MRSPSHFIKGGSRNHAENFIYFKFVVWEFHTWIWCVFFKSSQLLPFHSISVYNPTATAFSPDPMFSVWNSQSPLRVHADNFEYMPSLAPFSIYIQGGKIGLKKVGSFEGDETTLGSSKGSCERRHCQRRLRVGMAGRGVVWRGGQGGAGQGASRTRWTYWESRQMDGFDFCWANSCLSMSLWGLRRVGGEALTWFRTSVHLPFDV